MNTETSLYPDQAGCTTATMTTEEDWESACFTEAEINSAYHQLALPLDAVTVVDTLEGFEQCMECLTRPGTVVGVDSEWRPVFCGKVQK